MGEPCGAVAGAVIIIGLKFGRGRAAGETEKSDVYKISDMFIEKFRTRNSSVMCRKLVGFDFSSKREADLDSGRVIAEKCPGFVRDAAEIIEEILGSY